MQIVLTVYASTWSELQFQIADIQYYNMAKPFAVMGDSYTVLGLTCADTQLLDFPGCSRKSGVSMVCFIFFHMVPDMFNEVMRLRQMC